MKNSTKQIKVVPYDPNWPKLFGNQASTIQEILGDNCIAIHHIGSTSVPGLSAKPTIDIIAEVKNGLQSITPLEKIGFSYKGEWNIPFKYGFAKREGTKVNLHVFEEGHSEIALNLTFRDYLRANPQALKEYAELKQKLLSDDTAFHKQEGQLFSGYNLGKDAFIRKILKASNFNRLRFLRCAHHEEWAAARNFRQKYFFGPHNIEDPYTWTFNHPQHVHFVLSQGAEIVGYTHIQLWPDKRAAMRILVIDKAKRNNNLSAKLLALCEKWLKSQEYKSIHAESRTTSLAFYTKNGYTEMPFNDPEGYAGDPQDIAVGKKL